MDYDVFISCKSEDYKDAEEIYDFLTANGFNTFLAPKELVGLGDTEYRRAITGAMKSTYHLIIFASKAEYIDSTWVYYEWDMFLNAKLKGMKQGQIMTILKDIEIEDINMDLWKYESFTFQNYREKILGYVMTPGYKERRNLLRKNIEINTIFEKDKTDEEELIHLISEFSASKGGLMSYGKKELEFLYDMNEVSYFLASFNQYSEMYANILTLRDKILAEHLIFSHLILYIRIKKRTAGLTIQQVSDITSVLSEYNPSLNAMFGYSENSFRNEVFVILAR